MRLYPGPCPTGLNLEFSGERQCANRIHHPCFQNNSSDDNSDDDDDIVSQDQAKVNVLT